MKSPIKWHGGKHFLASKVVELMPPHTHYCEPFFGSGAVLLAKNPDGVSEVVNDLEQDLTTFWCVLQKPAEFYAFQRVIEATPFSEWEWQEASLDYDSRVEVAIAFFIRCRQSLAGRMESFAPLSRSRTRRGMNEQAAAWLSAVEGLPEVHARLKRVVILNRDALEVIRSQDSPDTLHYLDPPYLHESRASHGEYAHEMSEAQHRDLLNLVKQVQGKVMLSGYPSALYDDALAGWTRQVWEMPNHAAGGKSKRRVEEVLWCNW